MKIMLKHLSLAIAGTGMLTIYGCGGGDSSTEAALTPTPVTTPSNGVASLPTDLLTKPQAANCAALRSGSYDLVVPTANATAANQIVDRGTVDAVALTFTDSSGTSNLVATPGEACHFTANNGVNDIVVSPSGVIVARVQDSGKMKLAIAVPTQTFTVADLAGTFNMLGTEDNNGVYNGKAGTVTINTAGVVTAFKECSNAATWNVTNASCVDVTTGLPAFTVNSAGGFNLVDASTGHIDARMFAYKSGSGDVMFIMGGDRGGLTVFTKQRTNSLPTVGDTKTNWNLQLDNLLASPTAVSANSNTVVSVDSAAGSWVVRNLKNAGSTVTHPETFFANNPRNGYNFRAAGSALASDGTTATINEITTLNLNGMGLTAVLIPALKRFQFTVTQP